MENTITCPVCLDPVESHLIHHLKEIHNLDLNTFLNLYKNSPFLSEEMKEMLEKMDISPSPVSNYTHMKIRFGDKKVDIPFKVILPEEHVPEIDTNYVFMKAMYYVYEGLIDGHVYIFGETGLGKTDGVYQLAALLGTQVREMNMTGDTSPENFVGYLTAKEGSVFFKKGILLEAMEEGQWLLIDEIDYGNPNILSVLNNVMQFGFITIPETKEKIYAHKDFRIVATANTTGTGDETGFYQGTNPMNRALIDRFETAVEFEFPNTSELKEILTKRLKQVTQMDLILKFVYEMRKAVTNNQVYMPFGIRSALKFAKKLKSNKYEPWEAAQLSFANMLDTNSRDVVKALVQRVFGS